MTPTHGLFCILSLGLFFTLPSRSSACGGGYGPDPVLLTQASALASPIASFEAEVRLVTGAPPPPPIAPVASVALSDSIYPGKVIESSLDAEAAELREILSSFPEERRSAVLADYLAQRTTNAPRPSDHPWPADLPLDIRLYAEGASSYPLAKEAAIATWQELLALPPDQRRYRSTWAAWMIARSYREQKDYAAALPYYALCSRLSAEGFADPLHLGLSALGWQAKCELELGHFASAATLYYHQAMAGEPSAWASLSRILPGFDRTDPATLATDSFLRGLVTASLLPGGSNPFRHTPPPDSPVRLWLEALEKAQVDGLAEAARFAELAYSAGEFETARRWLARAPASDPRALWISGKLALMEGRTSQAERSFTRAASSVPMGLGAGNPETYESHTAATYADNRIAQLYGDLAVARMRGDQFTLALDALQRANLAWDATYVAERVLSLPEFMRYVDQRYPNPTDKWTDGYWHTSADISSTTRYRLARRLARQGLYADARRYLPPNLLPLFDRYVSLTKKGDDLLSPATRSARAAALWEAAQIEAYHGDELFGSPDTDFLRDRLGLPVRSSARRHYEAPPDAIDPPPAVGTLIPPPTPEERDRALRSILPWERRDRYLFTAANLAWKASVLMPDNSDATAHVLFTAGSWIKYESPKTADRFYKAMIWRNWSTPLAREADKLRWFPKVEWLYDPFAAAGVLRPVASESKPH